MATTIRDVAHRAGVSIATVSRALRDADTVTPQTRERVTRAAADLEYVPSQLGRQLAQGRHAANGIVFPDLSGPYYAEVVLGYESAAAQLDRSVLILSTHGRRDVGTLVTGLAARCDGIVVLGRTVDDEVVRSLSRRGTPVVLVARTPIDVADSLNAENSAAAAMLGDHLVDSGARTVTFVGDPEATSDVAERYESLRSAVERRGVELTLVSVADLSEDGGLRAAHDALARRRTEGLPGAFACANDELALGMLMGLREAGLSVPEDTLVSGWDDVMAARYAGLTTVRQPMRELGRRAAQLLDELINRTREEPVHEVLATELIIRTSTSGTTTSEGTP
ncbi:MAG: LacI family DNA-binding transcriptional regulator [Nocardioides sp.]